MLVVDQAGPMIPDRDPLPQAEVIDHDIVHVQRGGIPIGHHRLDVLRSQDHPHAPEQVIQPSKPRREQMPNVPPPTDVETQAFDIATQEPAETLCEVRAQDRIILDHAMVIACRTKPGPPCSIPEPKTPIPNDIERKRLGMSRPRGMSHDAK